MGRQLFGYSLEVSPFRSAPVPNAFRLERLAIDKRTEHFLF